MRFYDAFGGIGGFRLGLERCGFEDLGGGEPGRPNFECVGYCDWDKHAVACYNANFNESHKPTDITKFDAKTLPDFDLLVGGFPCQPFSLAGKRKGIDETRGTLFAELIRVAREKQPSHLLFENVKGLLSSNGGRDFGIILNAISELGYVVEWQVLNSKHFGVPQNRERVFIHGFREGSGREIFPLRASVGGVVGADEKERGSGETYLIEDRRQSGEVRLKEEVNVNAHYGTGGGNVPLVVRPVLTPDRAEKRQNGRRMKEDGEEMFTLTAQDKHGVFDGASVHRLTPTECERLQGFPDGWTSRARNLKGEYIQSDGQRYKQLGNAVTVNVIQALGEALLKNV